MSFEDNFLFLQVFVVLFGSLFSDINYVIVFSLVSRIVEAIQQRTETYDYKVKFECEFPKCLFPNFSGHILFSNQTPANPLTPLCKLAMQDNNGKYLLFFPGISVSLRVFQGDLDKVNLLSYYYSSLFFHRIERWKGWGGVGQAEQAHSLIISSKRSLLVRGFFCKKPCSPQSLHGLVVERAQNWKVSGSIPHGDSEFLSKIFVIDGCLYVSVTVVVQWKLNQ